MVGVTSCGLTTPAVPVSNAALDTGLWVHPSMGSPSYWALNLPELLLI